MRNTHHDKLLRLIEKNITSEVAECFSNISQFMGANYFSIIEGAGNKKPLKVIYSSCSEEGGDPYYKQGFLEEDPILEDFLDPAKLICLWKPSNLNSPFMKKCRDLNIQYKMAFFIRSPTLQYAIVFSLKEPCEDLIDSLSWMSIFKELSDLLGTTLYEKEDLLASQSLTKRELECLRWISEGKTAEEVGSILSISHWTVTFHLKNIYKKLNVPNKTAAILKATKLGLL